MLLLGFFCTALATHIYLGVDYGPDEIVVGLPALSGRIDYMNFGQNYGKSYPANVVYSGDSPEELSKKRLDVYSWNRTFTANGLLDNQTYMPHLREFIGKNKQKDLQQLIAKRHYPYNLDVDKDGFLMINNIHPETVALLNLKYIINRLKELSINKGDTVVLSIVVPKYWTSSQRSAIYTAATSLKIDCLFIESTAAITSFLKYHFSDYITFFDHRILSIYITSVSTEAVVIDYFFGDMLFSEENYYQWDDTLGLRDVDVAIATHFCKKYKFKPERSQFERLIQEMSTSKYNLNTCNWTSGNFEGISYNITRQEIENVLKPILKKFEAILKKVHTKLSPDDVDMIAVGGKGSKFFAFEDVLQKMYGQNRIEFIDNEPSILAYGASAIAYREIMLDTNPYYSFEHSVKGQAAVLPTINGNSIPIGNVTFKISSEIDKLPTGVPRTQLWAVVKGPATISLDGSSIILARDATITSADVKQRAVATEYTVIFSDLARTEHVYLFACSLRSEIVRYRILFGKSQELRSAVQPSRWAEMSAGLAELESAADALQGPGTTHAAVMKVEEAFMLRVKHSLALHDDYVQMRNFFGDASRIFDTISDRTRGTDISTDKTFQTQLLESVAWTVLLGERLRNYTIWEGTNVSWPDMMRRLSVVGRRFLDPRTGLIANMTRAKGL